MFTLCVDVALVISGVLVVCNAVENTTSTLTGAPVAAAVRSHFSDCPDSHRQFCFHGSCRFLVQEETPACICHSGFIGIRCEHADLLAVVATNQKQQTIATLVVVSIVVSVLLIAVCVLIHCCRKRRKCEFCQTLFSRHEISLLKSGAGGSHSDTGV
ncbi:protransforming growth factor alpha [Callorhinchus milii]|uniref:Protransforming growth factor alpha n=1 Tax=Callorhinchus milii TaxID=7868 RepID=V9LEP5_CALMI|nr:protransforming growth factor alpha [Callorhinchus milii]|eukprot:gi/632984495/ref/XP_007909167.1/ PREDICTED: protransforming growth factor alpha [Callorhinchus milii]